MEEMKSLLMLKGECLWLYWRRSSGGYQLRWMTDGQLKRLGDQPDLSRQPDAVSYISAGASVAQQYEAEAQRAPEAFVAWTKASGQEQRALVKEAVEIMRAAHKSIWGFPVEQHEQKRQWHAENRGLPATASWADIEAKRDADLDTEHQAERQAERQDGDARVADQPDAPRLRHPRALAGVPRARRAARGHLGRPVYMQPV